MKKYIIKKFDKKIKIFLDLHKNNNIIVSGPLGKVSYNINSINFLDNLMFIRKEQLNFLLKKINFLFKSVFKGWYIELILDGIGYKCFKNQNTIILDIGYSTLLNYTSNDKIKIKILKNKIVLFSIDKEYLNNVAIKLKKFALPNPYKGKGILFKNEIINLKKKT